MIDKYVLVAALASAGMVVAVWWYVKHRRDGFVSTSYTANCHQLCSIAHPQAFLSCQEDSTTDGTCKNFRDCIKECRNDQLQLKARGGGGESYDGWEGGYGKLIS